MDLHFASVWETVADMVPERTALICGDKTTTWAQYDDRGSRIAGLLQAHGLGADAKVGIYLHNSNEYVEPSTGYSKFVAAR